MKKLLTFFVFLLCSILSFAQDTIKVPEDYTTIQAAIDASTNGDIILVAENTYYENITFKGKAITVASYYLIDGIETHISQTIIDGSQPANPDSGSVVSFIAGEDTNSVLCGFTIRGGTGTVTDQGFYGTNDRIGGGIYIGAGARISHNIITNNTIHQTTANGAYGGGIACGGDNSKVVIIEYNDINHNNILSDFFQTGAGGVGIFSKTRLINNSITDNIARTNGGNWNSNGGGIALIFVDVVVSGNLIARNQAMAPNCTAYPCYGGGFHSFGSDTPLLFSNNTVMDNLVQGSSGSFGGGINLSNGSNQLILNNIILRNTATSGGGISCLTAQSPNLLNNTISSNLATNGQGGAIYSGGSSIDVENSVLWKNTNTSGSEIYGNASVHYCDIEGGFSGIGNIDLDPLFRDTLNNDFHLMSTDCGNGLNSPCIDAGNPAITDWFLDCNWGLGQIRVDMGAYGGDPNAQFQNELLGPKFRAFVNRVNSVPSNEKQTIIDSFMNASSSFPIIEENTIVYYIYQGAASSVNVPGDANEWATMSSPMTKLVGTTFWYHEAVYESDARLDYKYYLNGNEWILDPLNPNLVPGGYGPNSELAMPDYVQPPEVEYYPNIPHGTIDPFEFTSTILGNTRTIKIYIPFNYESQSTDHFPVLLLHDGLDYLNIATANNILDYLIALSKIDPIICVFVPPVDRDNEYALNLTQQFESFIIDELMPHIDSTYRTMTDPHKRAMGGLSYGGLITTQICYNHSEEFGLCAPYSPSYWAKNMEVFNLVLNGPQKDIKWYLDWGTYEWTILVNAVPMRDGLINIGYDLAWNEWHEAHSWGSWRAHLDNALEFFFQKPDNIADDENAPTEFALEQNYPNPFNPSTKIMYSVPQSSNVIIKVFDILGNEIETLINEEKPLGTYELTWTASTLPSGVYFYQLRAGAFVETKKMLLLK